MKKLLTLTTFAALFAFKASAQTTIAVKNASKHIGQTVKICDKVFGGKLIPSSNTSLLTIGGYDPNQPLTVMITGAARAKFKGKPEVDYLGKDIIVTGKLVAYKGKPEIIVSDPKQLQIVMVDSDFRPRISTK